MLVTLTKKPVSVVRKCMNCGKEIKEVNDLYSRRFCSVQCKQEYCEELGSIKSI